MSALGESDRGNERTLRPTGRPGEVDYVELDAKLSVYTPARGCTLIVRRGMKVSPVRKCRAGDRNGGENGRCHENTKPSLHVDQLFLYDTVWVTGLSPRAGSVATSTRCPEASSE